MRKPLIAGNWKMYKTPKESLDFLGKFLPLVEGHTRDEIAIFPTMSSLGYVIDATHGTNVFAGAQTMHWLNEGPYTGQTSPTMLASINCTHVLLGHSERRIYANETDEMVNLKLKAAIGHGLVPIVCVGETLEKRQANLTEAVLRWQIANALNGVEAEGSEAMVIAYGPIRRASCMEGR
jgi:triosephosphate isomerase